MPLKVIVGVYEQIQERNHRVDAPQYCDKSCWSLPDVQSQWLFFSEFDDVNPPETIQAHVDQPHLQHHRACNHIMFAVCADSLSPRRPETQNVRGWPMSCRHCVCVSVSVRPSVFPSDCLSVCLSGMSGLFRSLSWRKP